MDFKLSLCKNIVIPKQTYIVNMILMAQAAGAAPTLYRFFKLSEGSLSEWCRRPDICISKYLLHKCPTLFLTPASAAEHHMLSLMQCPQC